MEFARLICAQFLFAAIEWAPLTLSASFFFLMDGGHFSAALLAQGSRARERKP